MRLETRSTKWANLGQVFQLSFRIGQYVNFSFFRWLKSRKRGGDEKRQNPWNNTCERCQFLLSDFRRPRLSWTSRPGRWWHSRPPQISACSRRLNRKKEAWTHASCRFNSRTSTNCSGTVTDERVWALFSSCSFCIAMFSAIDKHGTLAMRSASYKKWTFKARGATPCHFMSWSNLQLACRFSRRSFSFVSED